MESLSDADAYDVVCDSPGAAKNGDATSMADRESGPDDDDEEQVEDNGVIHGGGGANGSSSSSSSPIVEAFRVGERIKGMYRATDAGAARSPL